MQGGDEYRPIHLSIIKYLYDNDIPLLAICMSMQAMGVLFNGKLERINNHKNHKTHAITIKKDTLLYRILKQERIRVNTSHKECLKDTTLDVSARSNCIEAIEDKNKRFFLGLQWHPEKSIDMDNNSKKIFDYFMEVALENR